MRLDTPHVDTTEHVTPKIHNSESGHRKLFLQNQNGTLISFQGPEQPALQPHAPNFPSFRFHYGGLRCSEVLSRNHDKRAKQIQQQTAEVGVGGYSLEWCRPNKTHTRSTSNSSLNVVMNWKDFQLGKKKAGKILVKHELVFMCSLGNLRNEQSPLCGNRGQVHGPSRWKHNKKHIISLFRAILHVRQWQRALLVTVIWLLLTLNSWIYW